MCFIKLPWFSPNTRVLEDKCNLLADQLEDCTQLNNQLSIQVRDLHKRNIELRNKYFWEARGLLVIAMSSDEITAILSNNIPNFGKWVIRRPMDGDYRVPQDEDIVKYILWNSINTYQYKVQFKDCDKFARKFYGDYAWDMECNNVGLVYDRSGGHAYIIFVRQNRGLWLYEPQNDVWWSTDKHEWGTGIYSLSNADIDI